MKRLRKLPCGVSQGLHYHPAKLRSVRGMAKHRTKGRGVPRNQKITLAKVRADAHPVNEIIARAECRRRGIDPDALCADGGVEAWMVVAKELTSR